ncbi:site-2 protease family protein [Candidatus Saccharibacteria bacterium]|nr:site-2 protease family protein [Candidatus Saccharibacteria bacterium]
MEIFVGVIVGLLMLMLLVVAHEFGHFIAARRNGVDVEEFGIGFPPRAIAWRKVGKKWRKLTRKEWDKAPGEGLIISLNWLPIGGFCQMHGESDADDRKGSFGQASYWSKTKILFAGVAMNWLVAFLIFTVLAFMGMPHLIKDQFVIESDVIKSAQVPVTITNIIEDSPAAFAQLKENDVITKVQAADGSDETAVMSTDDLLNFNERHAGEDVYMTFVRDGNFSTVSVKLNDKDSEYRLGAGIGGSAIYRSTWSAPIVGLGTTVQLTGETFKGIGVMLWNLIDGGVKQIVGNDEAKEQGAKELQQAGDSVSGPVGILGILFPAFTASGPRSLFFLVAIISVSLACMNVLPIPALDGGRWLMISIARLRKKRVSKEAEEKIVGRSFIVILILALLITVLDIFRLIG